MKPQAVDAWKWRVILALAQLEGPLIEPGDLGRVLAEGECDNYEAAHAAMYLSGVRHVLRNGNLRYELDGKRVYLEFTRRGDGFRMTEWGTEWEADVAKRLL